MTDDRCPSETLRAAAARLRQIASAATPGPWTATWQEDDWWSITGAPYAGMARPETASTLDRDNARHIATMHPGVALPLAAWLDAEADGEAFTGVDGATRVPHPTQPEALAVARAVLGEA